MHARALEPHAKLKEKQSAQHVRIPTVLTCIVPQAIKFCHFYEMMDLLHKSKRSTIQCFELLEDDEVLDQVDIESEQTNSHWPTFKKLTWRVCLNFRILHYMGITLHSEEISEHTDN